MKPYRFTLDPEFKARQSVQTIRVQSVDRDQRPAVFIMQIVMAIAAGAITGWFFF